MTSGSTDVACGACFSGCGYARYGTQADRNREGPRHPLHTVGRCTAKSNVGRSIPVWESLRGRDALYHKLIPTSTTLRHCDSTSSRNYGSSQSSQYIACSVERSSRHENENSRSATEYGSPGTSGYGTLSYMRAG